MNKILQDIIIHANRRRIKTLNGRNVALIAPRDAQQVNRILLLVNAGIRLLHRRQFIQYLLWRVQLHNFLRRCLLAHRDLINLGQVMRVGLHAILEELVITAALGVLVFFIEFQRRSDAWVHRISTGIN